MSDRTRHDGSATNSLQVVLLLAVAVFISFLYGYKHILLLHEQNWHIDDTVFFTSFEAWDVDHYLSQIKEVYEGNYLLSNAYLAEYKNTVRSPWPSFPNHFLAVVGKTFHIEVQHLAVLMDFVLPPLIFFLAYRLLTTLSKGYYIALLGAFLLVVTPHLFRVDFLMYMGIRFMKDGFSPPVLRQVHCYYCFAGTINPQLTYNFLLAALLFFSKGLITSKNRFFGLTALFGIITTYSYVYFSTYLYTVLTVSAIGLWLGKVRRLSQKTWVTLGAILLGSVPFWYPLLNFSSSEMNQMAFMVKDRTPLLRSSYINAHLGEQLVLTLLVCILIVYWIGKGLLRKIPGVISLALLISGIVCLEQHVITGIRVQPWHYDAYVNPQTAILVITLLAMEILPNVSFRQFAVKPLLPYMGAGMLVGGLVFTPGFVARFLSSDGILTPSFESFLQVLHVIGLSLGSLLLVIYALLLHSRFSQDVYRIGTSVTQRIRNICWGKVVKFLYALIFVYVIWDVGLTQHSYYYQNLKPKLGYLQQLAPALKWLNEYTPPESVVLGSPDHTSTNSIIPIYTHNNVYVTFHSQFYTSPPLDEIHDRLYNTMYLMGIETEQDFDEYLEDHWFEEGNFEIYRKKFGSDVYTELTRYQVDYVLYGPRERLNFLIDPEKTYPFLQKMYDDDIVKIYRIL